MHHMRVMDVPPRVGRGQCRQICVRDKERAELFNMFNTRFELHRKGNINNTDYHNEQNEHILRNEYNELPTYNA